MPYVRVYDFPKDMIYQVEVTPEIAAMAEAAEWTVTEITDPRVPVITYAQYKAGELPNGAGNGAAAP